MTVTHNRARPAGGVELTIAQLAEQAAESIRALNHLTYPGTGAPNGPADASEVVASLARVAGRIPQLLGQLSRWLVSEHRAAQLRLDAWSPTPDVGTAVTEAVADLTEAAEAARRAGRALDAANQVFAHLAAVDAWDDEVDGADHESATSARESSRRNACPE